MTMENGWQPMNQYCRYGIEQVLATAGNLATRKLRVKRLQPTPATGDEAEIPAGEFQATAGGEYTKEWLDFLTALSIQGPLLTRHADYYGKGPVRYHP